MIATTRNLFRLLRIAVTLARHDALFLLERLDVAPGVAVAARLLPVGRVRGIRGLRPGQRLALALRALGPTFIKLGQALSTRSDLLGEVMAADLSDLQDRLPPFPGAEARRIVEDELGAPIADLFDGFDDQPVAAASIAQVHFAVTKGKDGAPGAEVAVKVLRPGVEDAFARDFELFHWVARLTEIARPEMRRLKPVQSVHALEETVRMEMDLRFEAAAAAELAENFADDDTFQVPAIDWQRTARRVLTTERVHGIPIDEREALIEAGHVPDDVIAKAGAIFFNMVFRDGLFHADLHPGNLFVRADGAIVAVDFGIMGRVDRHTRRHLAEMLIAFLSADYRRAAEVHFEAGWVPPHKSVDSFTQACRSIAEPILGKPQNEISMARLLAQLFQVTEHFDMETQPQLLQLQKTMLLIEGTGRRLNPNANMWLLAQPLIEDWVHDNLGPAARVREAALDAGEILMRLPRAVDALERIAREGMRLHPDSAREMSGPAPIAVGVGREWGPAVVVGAVVFGLALALLG